jgi:hypothetical protein
MNRKKKNPVAPGFGCSPINPEYEQYMKKCLKKYPFLYNIIDYIVAQRIAALRAEMYQLVMYRPTYPGAYPGVPGPCMAPPGMIAPRSEMSPYTGFPMMPL